MLNRKPSSWFSASLELVALFLQYNNSHIYNNMTGVTNYIVHAEPEAIQLALSLKLAENQLGGFLFKKPPSWLAASFELVGLFLQYNNSHVYIVIA